MERKEKRRVGLSVIELVLGQELGLVLEFFIYFNVQCVLMRVCVRN